MKHIVIEKLVPDNIGMDDISIIEPSMERRRIVDLFCFSNTTNQYVDRFDSDKNREYYNNYKTDQISIYANKQSIHIGNYYGYNGITVRTLIEGNIKRRIDDDYPDNIFLLEIEEAALQKYAKKELKYIFENYNILITELKEVSAGTIDTMYIQGFDETSQYTQWHKLFDAENITPKQVYIFNINFSKKQDEERYNITYLPPAPVFWLHTLLWQENINVSKYTDLIEQVYKDQKFKKLYVMPINKPRFDRLELLSCFDNVNALDIGDWSLSFNTGHIKDKKGKVYRQSAQGYLTFVDKYKHCLPKFIEDVDTSTTMTWQGLVSSKEVVHDHNYINFNWLRDYQLYIAVETTTVDPNYTMISEKIFKGIASGMLTIPYGTQNTLPHLTALGFDMSFAEGLEYDTIPTHKERATTLAKKIIGLQGINTQSYVNTACSNLELFCSVESAVDAFLNPLRSLCETSN